MLGLLLGVRVSIAMTTASHLPPSTGRRLRLATRANQVDDRAVAANDENGRAVANDNLGTIPVKLCLQEEYAHSQSHYARGRRGRR